MKIIDLNADLGEGMPHEQEILPLISSANICCGAHAGSPEITRATVISCLRLGIRIGAHPGYPDPEHFGRRSISELDLTPLEILSSLETQILSVPQARYIKPHGAFYTESSTMWQTDEEPCYTSWLLLQDILFSTQLPLLGLADTPHEINSKATSVKFIREGFIDRRYDNNHRLLPRSNPEAIIHDPQEAIDQALRLAETCDSLCVHGDNPNAPELLTKVRSALESGGYTIAPK
ncbi:hypothetical protein CCB80_11210 [Armatimonadetes bacterium Uphvl-Ar1]|nr:hypothetical protein CCB80_11210 [Armatimonadetes bacterium Uphvl-Ar1]